MEVTSNIPPLAKAKLVDELDNQVQKSISE